MTKITDLKVTVSGNRGSGKTSLLRIIQQCLIGTQYSVYGTEIDLDNNESLLIQNVMPARPELSKE